MRDPRTKAGDRRAKVGPSAVTRELVYWGCFCAVAFVVVVLLAGCERAPQRTEPDPVAVYIVNTQPYTYGNMEPVHYAYEQVAEWRGWTPEQIEGRRAWLIDNVVMGESGGCWMIFGGTLYNDFGDPCTQPHRVGRKSDAGFGQVTPALYGRNATLCKRDGLCSKHDVVRSAWDSMNAMVAAYEYHGSFPWCWNAGARAYHNCKAAPKI